MNTNILTERGFDDLFNKIKQNRSSSNKKYSLDASLESERGYVTEAMNSEISKSLQVGPQNEYVIQGNIRKYFNKDGINTGAIASHPDFLELSLTGETINQYICTVFIDIKGSTRLSLLYDLEFIYNFKNAVLQTCIEIVRSFDGYVHRLMGDALMAFFGSRSIDKEQAVIDAINCSLMCKLMLENAIKPWLEKQKNFDSSNFGFRIGCNFGDDEEVLWGNYGYGNLGEISPTGLPVDLAAKLQSLASKNEIMLGQGIINFINWPEEFSSIKTIVRNGVEVPIEFVTPNYKKHDGTDLNYSMRVLDYKRCLAHLPIDLNVKSLIPGSKTVENPLITYSCDAGPYDGDLEKYVSASKFLEKNMSLRFTVEANSRSRLKFPLKVTFKKKNHGPDVPPDDLKEFPTERTIYNSSDEIYCSCSIDEGTSYRGIHTMECEVRDNDNLLIYRNKIAVLIK